MTAIIIKYSERPDVVPNSAEWQSYLSTYATERQNLNDLDNKYIQNDTLEVFESDGFVEYHFSTIEAYCAYTIERAATRSYDEFVAAIKVRQLYKEHDTYEQIFP